MKYTLVSFDQIYDYIGMPTSFWKKAEGMTEEEKKQEIRNSLSWPDGFLEQLKGLPLEEQMKYYGISEDENFSKSSYGEIDSEREVKHAFALSEYEGLKALIVEEDVIIGVCIDSFLQSGPWGAPAFPYQDICTYIAVDNDGSGTDDREDYAHLFCKKEEIVE